MFLIGRGSSVRDADVILRFSSSVPDKADVMLLVPEEQNVIKCSVGDGGWRALGRRTMADI